MQVESAMRKYDFSDYEYDSDEGIYIQTDDGIVSISTLNEGTIELYDIKPEPIYEDTLCPEDRKDYILNFERKYPVGHPSSH
jgi:hypothetical protein